MDEQRRDAIGQRLELDRPIQQVRAGHRLVIDHWTIVIAAQHKRKISTDDHRCADDTPESSPVVLGHAGELARHAGEGNVLLQHFGPVNVATWGVNVAVELGRGPAAAESLVADAPRLLDEFGSAVRGGALYFDLARAYAQAEGDRDREAIQCLDTADRLAPQYVRPDPMARDLVLTLDRRARRRVWELESLRNRLGVGAQG